LPDLAINIRRIFYRKERTMISFRDRINRTRQKTQKIDIPRLSIDTPSKTYSDGGKRCAAEISNIIYDLKTKKIGQYLYAENIRNIALLENRTVNLAATLTCRTKDTGNISGPAPYENGELHFNPDFFSCLSGQNKRGSIEHELWHVYLGKAFPAWDKAVNSFAFDAGLHFPFLSRNFTQQFTHLYLRSAALESGKIRFAINDAEAELYRFISETPHIKNGPGGIYRASKYCGTLLSCVFPFTLSSDMGERRNEYLNLIFAESQRSDNRAVFDRAFELATDIFMNFCIYKKDDLNMKLFAPELVTRWSRFIGEHAPSMIRD
jgi:hypothetical protein